MNEGSYLTRHHITGLIVFVAAIAIYLALKNSAIGGQVGTLAATKLFELYDRLPLALAGLALGFILGRWRKPA